MWNNPDGEVFVASLEGEVAVFLDLTTRSCRKLERWGSWQPVLQLDEKTERTSPGDTLPGSSRIGWTAGR